MLRSPTNQSSVKAIVFLCLQPPCIFLWRPKSGDGLSREVLRHTVGDGLGVAAGAVAARTGGPLVAVVAGDEAVAQVDEHPGGGHHRVDGHQQLGHDRRDADALSETPAASGEGLPGLLSADESKRTGYVPSDESGPQCRGGYLPVPFNCRWFLSAIYLSTINLSCQTSLFGMTNCIEKVISITAPRIILVIVYCAQSCFASTQ